MEYKTLLKIDRMVYAFVAIVTAIAVTLFLGSILYLLCFIPSINEFLAIFCLMFVCLLWLTHLGGHNGHAARGGLLKPPPSPPPILIKAGFSKPKTTVAPPQPGRVGKKAEKEIEKGK